MKSWCLSLKILLSTIVLCFACVISGCISKGYEQNTATKSVSLLIANKDEINNWKSAPLYGGTAVLADTAGFWVDKNNKVYSVNDFAAQLTNAPNSFTSIHMDMVNKAIASGGISIPSHLDMNIYELKDKYENVFRKLNKTTILHTKEAGVYLLMRKDSDRIKDAIGVITEVAGLVKCFEFLQIRLDTRFQSGRVYFAVNSWEDRPIGRIRSLVFNDPQMNNKPYWAKNNVNVPLKKLTFNDKQSVHQKEVFKERNDSVSISYVIKTNEYPSILKMIIEPVNGTSSKTELKPKEDMKNNGQASEELAELNTKIIKLAETVNLIRIKNGSTNLVGIAESMLEGIKKLTSKKELNSEEIIELNDKFLELGAFVSAIGPARSKRGVDIYEKGSAELDVENSKLRKEQLKELEKIKDGVVVVGENIPFVREGIAVHKFMNPESPQEILFTVADIIATQKVPSKFNKMTGFIGDINTLLAAKEGYNNYGLIGEKMMKNDQVKSYYENEKAKFMKEYEGYERIRAKAE